MMKLRVLRILLISLLVLSMALPLFACDGPSDNDTPAETTVSSESGETPTTEAPTEEPTQEVTEAPLPTEVSLPEGYATPDITYECQDDSVFYGFSGKTEENFNTVLDGYKALGFRVYSDVTKNGSRFTTLVGDGPLAHIYWLKNSGDLNIVLSSTAGATLPPAAPDVTTGDTPVTVTQMKDANHVNGMGYFVQLSDGSFIVFDGSYSDQSRRLVKAMQDLCPAGQKPLVRAWVLSHSHDDHWPTFHQVALRQASSIIVEYVIFSPIDPEIAVSENGDTYFNTDIHEDIATFGAKTVYAHTGMEFTFCNLKMEVLLSSDDIYKDGVSHGAWFFNNSSLVVRLYDESYNFLVMGDIGKVGADLMLDVYGNYLKSDMIQIAHHGVEDVPLYFYETAKGSILWYPCAVWLYDAPERNNDVRDALRERDYTKEILIAGLGQYTRSWGTTFEADAPLSVPDHPTLGTQSE